MEPLKKEEEEEEKHANTSMAKRMKMKRLHVPPQKQ
jgi:hypothetical protein